MNLSEQARVVDIRVVDQGPGVAVPAGECVPLALPAAGQGADPA